MGALAAKDEFAASEILPLQRMAAMTGRVAALETRGQGRLWAEHVDAALSCGSGGDLVVRCDTQVCPLCLSGVYRSECCSHVHERDREAVVVEVHRHSLFACPPIRDEDVVVLSRKAFSEGRPFRAHRLPRQLVDTAHEVNWNGPALRPFLVARQNGSVRIFGFETQAFELL